MNYSATQPFQCIKVKEKTNPEISRFIFAQFVKKLLRR